MNTYFRRKALVFAALGLSTACGTLVAQTAPDLGQHVAVPAYISPSDTVSWNSLNSSTPQLGFLVANVNSGPSRAPDPAWKAVIDAAHARGVKVLGYVDSGYFGASVPVRYTALGDTDATSWTVQAQQQINQWYAYYGSSIDGIFLDDGMNTCGPTAGSNTYAKLYENLNNYIHSNHPGSLTVVNPGISVPQCYENSADIIVSFEGDAVTYLNPPAGVGPQAWQLNGDPAKFWNIVFNVSQAQLGTVMSQSKIDNAGYIYATPRTLGENPYSAAPTGAYWTSEQAATVGVNQTVPSKPAKPAASDIYSTGADLHWTSAFWANAVGYEVYQNGLHVASVGNFTPQDTEYTPVGLIPATSYAYTVRARSQAGVLSAVSDALNITTDVRWGNAPTAPGSLTASNIGGTSVQLSWAASVGSNDQVAFYDVYQNGTKIVTLPSTVTSIHLGGLTPGGTAYSFYVVARVTSDTASAPSNTVNVVTITPPPISSPVATFSATDAHFQLQYNLSYADHNVFIDTDGKAGTGYAVNGIGAEYLIQNGVFYVYSGSNQGWGWTAVALASSPLKSAAGNLYIWDVPTSAFGAGVTALTVVFNGSNNQPTDPYLAPIVVKQQ